MSKQEKAQAIHAARQVVQASTPARERLSFLFDPDSFVELSGFAGWNQQMAGVLTGYGSILGSPAYAFVQDSSCDSGAVSRLQGEKIKKIYELAKKTGAPVIGVYDSQGLKLEEGVDALAAYGEMLRLSSELSGVVPQIALVLGTCAGTSALIAGGADFVVISEGAELFLTPPAVSAAKGDVAKGAGSALAAAQAGVAHILAATEQEAIEKTRKLVSMLPLNNLAAPAVFETQPAEEQLEEADTPDAQKICGAIADAGSALELMEHFGTGVYTGIASLGGYSGGLVITKGEYLTADDSAKIARLVQVCDAFQLPVVTFVDTPGFAPSSAAEQGGAVRSMARLAHVYAEATTPKVAVITGQAYGAAYITLAGKGANADYTVAWPSATISALEPATAVALLHEDRISSERSREAVEEDYRQNEASPLVAASHGYLDDIIAPQLTRDAVLAALDLLSAKRVHKMPKKHGNIPL